MLKNFLSLLVPKNSDVQRAEMHRTILRKAAQIGGQVFGPVPAGVRREFFCLDEHTWVWHEEWSDANGLHHVRTTRYDVRPHGIFKAQDGQPYQPVSKEEALRLYHAVDAYAQAVDGYFLPRLAQAA
jgi:hypothetical protein